jgi:hypothetical protein
VAFVRRFINVSFGLATGSFAGGGAGVTLEGLRCSVKIVRAGSAAMSLLEATIYGMPLAMMNQLSTLGMHVRDVTSNVVTVQVRDENSNFSTVFSGNIINAWLDGKSQPQVAFRVIGNEAGAAAATPIPVSSYPGGVAISTILSNLAGQANPPMKFENNGVNAQISNPYFSGTLRTQIYEAINASGAEGGIVENNTLAIWPRDKFRAGKHVTISPTTGMVGYPAFTKQGIIVQTEYNPNIVSGGLLTVTGSQIDGANGDWTIGGVTQDLESETPKGQWFTGVSAYSSNAGTVIPALAP